MASQEDNQALFKIALATRSIFNSVYSQSDLNTPSNLALSRFTSFGKIEEEIKSSIEVIWDIADIPGMEPLPQDLFDGVNTSSMERNKKVAMLSQEDQGKYRNISHFFDDYEKAYWKHMVISQKYFPPSLESESFVPSLGAFTWKRQAPKVNENFREAYKENENLLRDLEEKISNECNREISISYIKKNIPAKLNTPMLADFFAMKERVLNHFINEKVYLISANNFIIENKNAIFKGMNILKNCNSSTYEIDNIEFINKSAETHNQGKKPLYITLRSVKENNVIELVLKPRDANIDKSIINCFSKVNEYDCNNLLPVYDIVNIEGV
ncbi:MAG: hypothetical protein H0V82_02555 [Candidatus Protochlamydia sp.]|nr:hypothetical protein [Candidatus Protochlamydia sp.]